MMQPRSCLLFVCGILPGLYATAAGKPQTQSAPAPYTCTAVFPTILPVQNAPDSLSTPEFLPIEEFDEFPSLLYLFGMLVR